MPKVLAIGQGPGPKNVLLELDDGSKTVVTYRTYKYKYSEGVKLSDGQKKQYVTAEGFVQFDPIEREANGKKVTDITITTSGGDGKNIRVTLWPEFQLDSPVEKGDWVAVDGEFSSSTYQTKDTGETRTSLQISPYKLAIVKGIKRAEREVVAGSSSSATKAENIPF